MAKTRRTRMSAENDHRRVTRPNIRIIIHETRGYLMGYLQTPSDTIQHDHESLEVGYETAMDRSNFFLLNGVIRDEPRASPPPLHAEQPGGMTTDFSKKKILPNKKAHLGCVEEDIRQFTPLPDVAGSAADGHKPFRDPLVYPETLRDSRSYSIASDGARR